MKSSFVFSVAPMGLFTVLATYFHSCSLETEIPYSCPVSQFELAA
jgi:hypothetical protein